jgi:hypothetical protein
MPASCLWPFRPAAHEESEKYTVKVMYRCVGCRTKVWGKGGLGLVCECGNVFVGETGEIKVGLAEKIYTILAEQYG